jgi:hypothetical protein
MMAHIWSSTALQRAIRSPRFGSEGLDVIDGGIAPDHFTQLTPFKASKSGHCRNTVRRRPVEHVLMTFGRRSRERRPGGWQR